MQTVVQSPTRIQPSDCVRPEGGSVFVIWLADLLDINQYIPSNQIALTRAHHESSVRLVGRKSLESAARQIAQINGRAQASMLASHHVCPLRRPRIFRMN